MRRTTVVLTAVLVSLFVPVARPVAQDFKSTAPAPTSVDALVLQARQRAPVARVALAPLSADVEQAVESLEPAGSGRTPNYLRALGALNRGVAPFAHLVRSVFYDGDIPAEIKMAMGLRVAQVNASAYAAAHFQRWLGGTEHGRALLASLKSDDFKTLRPAERLAIRYAESLTREIHGVSDEDFRTVRGYFNDGQVVELTLTVCFFNYFTRMTSALNLPVEPWVFGTSFIPPAETFDPPAARVNLISDRQLEWATTAAGRRQASGPAGSAAPGGAAFGVVNSQRAMMLSPDIASSWRAYTGSIGDNAVDRTLKLHVSFAVSEANGCRYCTLHQVQGLRRQGVSIEKLLQMKKDDSALSPRELTAVEFARQLTRQPSSISDAMYEKLRTTFTDLGALEIVLQTSNFAFMNRFTDGLRLPSEDEAVRVYREVYRGDYRRGPVK